VVTGLLVLAVIGLGIWALSLRADNDDKDATIAAQQQELEQDQGVADDVREAASNLAEDTEQARSELRDQIDALLGAAATTQEDAQAAVDRAEDAAADARARLDDAGDEVDRARADADAAKADAEAIGACARGYLSAISGAFDAPSLQEGAAQARSDVEALSASCSGKLGN
jgi:hypothetical protein